jgi:hypothetical protein
MVKKSGILSICLVGLWLLCPFSEGLTANLGVGSLEIHPFATGSVGYTDNVFLTDSNEKSDTYLILSPGVRLILPHERYEFNLDYTFDYYKYKDRDEADRMVHNLTGTFDYEATKSLDLRLTDSFLRSEDQPDAPGDRTSAYILNTTSFDAYYDLSTRFALGAGYDYTIKRFSSNRDDFDDYDAHGFSGEVYYRVLPKTSALLSYEYRARRYDRRRIEDSDSNRIEGGITWEITAKSSGTVKAGYQATDYEKLRRTDEALSYAINIAHQLRPKTKLTVEGVREILDTSASDDNVPFSNSYVSTQIAASLSHRYRKLTGRLRLGYIFDDYLHDDISAGKEREDELITAEFGIDWGPRKWLQVGTTYRHTRLDSNFEAEDYSENAILAYISVIL